MAHKGEGQGMGYERHESMVAPARDGAALWRTVVGVALSTATYVGLLLFTVSAIRVALPPEAALKTLDEFAEGDTPRGALMLLFSFVFMALGPILLARPLHHRSSLSYLGPLRAAFGDFWRVARALLILSAVLWLILPQGFDLAPALDLRAWLALLPITALALLVQTGAEEIAFRGYLQSQIAARFRSPLVWMLLPSALFAFGHYLPEDAGDNALAFAGLAFLFGLAAADLTARSGTLGAALAFHFVNNLFAIGLAALPGPLSGVALYHYPFAASAPEVVPLLWLDIAVIGLSWLAARVALRH